MAVPTRYSPLFGFGLPANPRPARPPAQPGLVQAPPPPPVGSPGGGGGGSGPPEPIPNCPPGTQYDPYANACVAVGQGPTLSGNFPGTTTTVTTGPTTVTTTPEPSSVGEGPIYVDVQNAVNVADNSANNAINGVAQAVRSGIQAGTNLASQSADAAIQAVQYGIDNLTTQLANQIGDAQTSIANVISGLNTDIGNTLGGIGATIGNSIFASINPVTTALAGIIQIISQQIGGLAGAIGTAVAQVIPTIIAAVTGAISPATAVLSTIERDINAQIGSLTQLGSDVSGGFGSLDSTLGRILTSWETYNSGFVESQTGYPDGGSLHSDLSSIWKALAGLITTLAGTATFKASNILAPPCNSQTVQNLLNAPYNFGDQENSFFKDMGIVLWTLALNFLKVIPAALKINDIVGQDVDLDCPTGLLPYSALVDAKLRGFLSDTQIQAEAGKGNLDPTRFKTLVDLATHQMSPAELVEAEYRGYISQTDYNQALSAQGWTAGQQKVLQGLSVPQIRPATYNSLNELLQRGIIDGQAFDGVLQGLNFDDGQRKALRDLVFRPTFQTEETEGLASEDLWGGLAVGGLGQAPESVQTAGAAEGLDTDAVNRRWLAHWYPGSFGLWIDLYFRGIASYQQLQAIFRRSYIPDQIHSSIVAASRPLIQYRTIQRMVFLKLLTPEQGKAQLLKHGFSNEDADTLINYALVSGKAPAAQVAKVQHGVSVGIAKEEYIDGSISAAQFYDVLVAHQFTPEGANTEIAVIDAHEAMLARKAAAQLIVDEYGAGLISETVALAQLAAQGLTVAELAKYAHKIRAFRVKNAKLPTEAELKKMLKAGIITDSEYISTLQQSGYPAVWAERFHQLDAPASASTPQPAGNVPVAG